MWKCPNSKEHGKFMATAHVTQDWTIDEDNHFIECNDECVQVTHHPSSEDMVTCSICGSEAIWID